MTDTIDRSGLGPPGEVPPAGPALVQALAAADPRVAEVWDRVSTVARSGPGPMGLAAGDRPAADIEVLSHVLASAEYTLAVFLHAGAAAGCLPFADSGGLLAAGGWGRPWARRLANAAALAADHPSVASVWASGQVTSDHLEPIARVAERFTAEELAGVLRELAPLWGQLSPAAVARFVSAADRMLHPPPDPGRDEVEAYDSRSLSFAVTRDAVLISGELPRIEGELVMAAIEALAERKRSTVEHTPAAARRADALVELATIAAAAEQLPTRGGLPVAVTVTIAQTGAGDAILTSSRGHQLTQAETRWACCDAMVTPVLVEATGCNSEEVAVWPQRIGPRDGPGGPGGGRPHGAAARIAALATALFDTRMPLAVGRTARTATPAQRRALAVRDRGCIVPGCSVRAEACQAHHLTDWGEGGETDIQNLALLCWAHHRQVDLHQWTIAPVRAGSQEPERIGRRSRPANNGAPFRITHTPRNTWRL